MNAVPLVLCGPIVRRVTLDQAAIFLVLREPAKVTLTVTQGDETVMIGSSSTQPLGEALHVIMVRADATQAVKPGTWCHYDIHFETTKGSLALGDRHVLTVSEYPQPIDRLVYRPLDRPGFMTPADELETIRVLHGSCRKPHGAGADALTHGDRLIEQALKSGGVIPQQLLMTGDQIYADDVHDLLLTAIRQVAAALFGTTERTWLAGQYGDQALQPGSRAAFVTRVGSLTSGSARSHLITLGEFVAMYLMVWSPAVWAACDKETLEAIDAHGMLRAFRRGLGRVRRLLANIPSLMIFDDHEVTDDWNLRGAWQAAVRAKPLGRRIVRNALAAYAVFQHWGNCERDLPEGLLDAVGGNSAGAPESLDRLLGGLADPADFHEAMEWHWTWRGPLYQIIGLDTRTRRRFAGDRVSLLSIQAINRLFDATAARADDGTAPRFCIALSATPLLGLKLIEGVQRLVTAINADWADEVDAEPWGHTATYDAMLNRLFHRAPVVVLSGDVHYGFAASSEARSGPYAGRRIINFTASALRNESKWMRRLGWLVPSDRLESADGTDDPTPLYSERTFRVDGEVEFEVTERIEGVALTAPDAPLEQVRLEANTDDARGAILGRSQLGEITLASGTLSQTLHYFKRGDSAAHTRVDTLAFPLEDG